MICSGYLVTAIHQEIESIPYKGVGSNPWPLGKNSQFFSAITMENLFVSQFNVFQPFLVSYAEAVQYQHECTSFGVTTRILFCQVHCDISSSICVPCYNERTSNRFLGIDYAYPNETYFSVLANEVSMGKTNFLRTWKGRLNANGLLNTISECTQFVREREKISCMSTGNSFFEVGPFMPIEVYEVENKMQLEK